MDIWGLGSLHASEHTQEQLLCAGNGQTANSTQAITRNGSIQVQESATQWKTQGRELYTRIWRLLQTQWRTGKDKSAGSKLQSLAENWNMNIRCFQMPFKWISTLEPHVYCTYPNVLFEDKSFKLKSMPYSLPQVASKQFLVTTFIQFFWPNFFLSVAHPGMYVSYLLI